ncbi:hypothetical protein NS330_01230 [Curtobacterium citreum]|nr:hypothetical protein NS330_01230 [Curtobacterium citreum]
MNTEVPVLTLCGTMCSFFVVEWCGSSSLPGSAVCGQGGMGMDADVRSEVRSVPEDARQVRSRRSTSVSSQRFGDSPRLRSGDSPVPTYRRNFRTA